MWNNNKTTLLFMAIALVGFIWVKILPYFPNRPEHETGKISVRQTDKPEGSKILSGHIISSRSDTLCSVGVLQFSDNSYFEKFDGILAKEQVIVVPVSSDSIPAFGLEETNKFDIAALDSTGNLISIRANMPIDSATRKMKKSNQWLITNPAYFESKHITEGCSFVINPR